MAGSAKDVVKRSAVRKYLRSQKNREKSDREIAKECGCGRMLVKTVRMEMIAAGQHEPITEQTHGGHAPNYKPGAILRGGYVYDDDGKPVKELTYYKRQQAKRRADRQAGA